MELHALASERRPARLMRLVDPLPGEDWPDPTMARDQIGRPSSSPRISTALSLTLPIDARIADAITSRFKQACKTTSNGDTETCTKPCSCC